MEGATEIRYVGVVVGRATDLRDRNDRGAFIGFPEPLPVGTRLVLKSDGPDEAAEVVSVTESADPAQSGMQVRFVAARGAGRPVEPAAPAPVAVPAAAASASSGAEAEAVPAPVSAGGAGGEGESGSTGGNRRRRRRR